MADPVVIVLQPDPVERARTVEALARCCDRERIGEAADEGQVAAMLGMVPGHKPVRTPRVLLVDLPLEPGAKLLQDVRGHASTAGLPVIALVTGGDRALQDAWYRCGANSVVARTPDDEELGRKMRRLFDYWTTVNVANRPSRI